MINMTVIKRFIAGAVCPRCGKQDTLRMYRDDEREHRDCVQCDFSDSLRLDGEPEITELETRVTAKERPSDKTEDVQPLKFFPNPSLRRDH